MYNATNAATWLTAPQRFATRLRVLRRASTQRFVCYNASPRGSASHRAPRLPAAHRASIQLNDLFVNLSSHLRAPPLNATCLGALRRTSPQLNDLFITPRRNVAYSIAALFGSTQRFVCYFASPCIAPQHITLLRADQQRNATICLLLFAPHLAATWLAASRLPATQRFVYQFIITTRRSALLRHAPRRVSTRRISTQRTET